jgi:putative peptidoglycan lipid II flippase
VVEEAVPAEPEAGRNMGRNTALYAAATGASRVAGLAREIIAARYFGTSGRMSAFVIAFQVPNLFRALLADSALQGAFVPVFTELLEKGRRREAMALASNLISLFCLALGGLTVFLVAAAPVLMPLLTPGFPDGGLRDLTVVLSQIMFPVVLLFALSGLIGGMLNSMGHFTVPALAPVAWNLVVIGVLVGAGPFLSDDQEIYAYAIGVLTAAVVHFALPLPWLKGAGIALKPSFDWRDPNVRRVLSLMLPVTLTLGLFNFSLLINSLIATLVSDQAPAAIDRAFRICVLPQGVFTVAIVTILFPTLSRYAARGAFDELRSTMATGVRLICLLTIPSAILLAVLAEPITRLVYQRGAFGGEATDLVAEALFVWAFSLPIQGVGTLLSQAFFSLRKPWVTTVVALGYVVVNAAVSLALYKPLGIAGVVLGTVAANVGMTVAKSVIIRPVIGGLEGRETVSATARMLVAGAAFGGVAWGVWQLLDDALGHAALLPQVVSVGVATVAASAVYLGLTRLLRVPETDMLIELATRPIRRRIGTGEAPS